jgi:hypothetical protein
MKNIKKAALAVVVVLGGISYQAHAGGVNTYAGLGANDSISWGQLGGTYSTTGTPVGVISGGGLNALVTDGGDVVRLDENPGGSGWAGIFNSGDELLYNDDNGDVVIDFAMPVEGAGAYIQQNESGNYTGTITAYMGATVLGSETVSGNNDLASVGTAPFAGWLEGTADITSVSFSTSPDDDFAIDTLALVDTAGTAPDAASTSFLLGMASLGLGIFRKKLVK